MTNDGCFPSKRVQIGPTLPLFSIIVPTWNRPRQLRACLRALARLDYPKSCFEVIVVDDGSEPALDATDLGGLGSQVTWLRQSNAGPAAARNAGAEKAQGKYLAFTDDDCMPAPGWLNGFVRAFEEAPQALVGGRTANGLPDNTYSTASQMIVNAAMEYFLATRSKFQFFASNNLAIPADLFHTIGGFDVSFRTSEDRDFCDRWVREGHRLVYTPNALIQHYHELTFAGFLRQHFGYGKGANRFHRARARRGAEPFRPELSFYRNVFRYSLAHDKRMLSVAALLCLWQVANAAGYLWQCCRLETTNEIARARCMQPTVLNWPLKGAQAKNREGTIRERAFDGGSDL
ncbi:MAG: putative glycosyltransferase [Nitrospira sp.]|jgi:GT2 family glycosyltransferase|nr:putative glycosyltransferase [Nitrospira sp.]